ncbi:transporter substrate-binding domain-containing protein [Marinobacter salsuginis]|uniref:transporter substrate-binding domain-containing protein n=2 Tax=Marinobacter TaxID=2742 RepID=UPI001ADFB9BF|nr:transporter substrate-binding domain-containing protein [Marinobacter salsuginis]QTN42634.1 transporter substrate-binding domain-containing protein [Marinobacter salsuginis]|tara:strand:- start:2740 stop:3807 length:1068 start_codon:yes stop_codon:yes gene_type:complete
MVNRIFTWFFLLTLAISVQVHAQTSPLRVGITEVPPFAMKNGDGRWEGISVDLWQEVAAGIDREFKWVPMSFNELLNATENGEIDVAVGALTMTADREGRFDFSHPFYQTGLSIAVPPVPEQSLLGSLRAMVSWQFVSVVLALGALLLAVGFLLWLVERRRNPEQFGGSAAEGIGSSFWWAAVTMTTVGYGDKAPVTFPGRLIALVWMFAGLIMVASFTAAITSSLTVSNLRTGIEGVGDLPGKIVATIGQTASQRYLEEERIRYQTYPNLTAAMTSVADGESDAIVYDRPLMQYRNQQLGEKRLTILPGVFAEQLYALALPEGSPIRAPVSQEILRVTESEDWVAIQAAYLGRE